jgi:predicted regulator of Ras-like GTPase activity (Roadblock/LC7/MglB family)
MTRTTGTLDWMLADFTRDIPGVDLAVVLSADGLRLATSPGVTEDLGDQIAAAAAGLSSLARGTARLLDDGKLTQTILEMEGGYLFVSAIAQGATLVVHATRGCDMGLVGYEMTMLVTRAGHALTPAPRTGIAR